MKGQVKTPERKVKVLVTQLCPTLWTSWAVAHQAPVSMDVSRQEYWSGLPFPSPGDLSNPRIEPNSLALQADSFTLLATREAYMTLYLAPFSFSSCLTWIFLFDV